MSLDTQPTTGSDPLAEDLALRKELAAMFLEMAPAQLGEIRTALSRRDAIGLKAAAHTFKGSVGIFKDQPAYDAALRLEHVGRDADWEHADEAARTLEREAARLSADLANLVSPGGTAARGDRTK